jgi:hypothetical protein
VSYGTCQKILKKVINSFAYKIGVLYEIKPGDYPKRMITITEFCQSISSECLINVFENMKRRLLDQNGEHFKEFL